MSCIIRALTIDFRLDDITECTKIFIKLFLVLRFSRLYGGKTRLH